MKQKDIMQLLAVVYNRSGEYTEKERALAYARLQEFVRTLVTDDE